MTCRRYLDVDIAYMHNPHTSSLPRVSSFQTLEWFGHEQHLLLVASGAGLRCGRSPGLRSLQSCCQVEMIYGQASSILPPRFLHCRKTKPPTPVLQGSRETSLNLSHPPHPTPTRNFVLLSESWVCGIPKKSGNQAVTWGCCAQLLLPYSNLLG